jgi:hypothetical protein
MGEPRRAGRELGVSTEDAIVVEDSGNGLRAAVAAGLRTVVTVSGFTREEDFTGASLVVSSLGDPDGEQAEVLASPAGVEPSGVVTLATLQELLSAPASHAATTETETP